MSTGTPEMHTPAPRISVVIPTYQRCALLRRTLQLLATQTLPPDQYEVIVSIDGSEDGTREMVAALSVPYRLHALWRPNSGRAAACNAGIHQAAGDLLVLLDDDMEPVPGFLEAHLDAHRRDPRLAVIGAVPVTVGPGATPVLRYVGSKFNRHLERLARADAGLGVRDFYTGNFSIPRRMLLDAGGFEPAFKVYGNEDIDLCLRLQGRGLRFVYSPEALAHQRYTKDFAGLARDSIGKGQTSVLLASRHPDIIDGLRLSGYSRTSYKRRLLRAVLLWMSGLWPKTPDWVIRFVTWLEQRRPQGMELVYDFVLDYYYWWGVRSALRERAGSGAVLAFPPAAGPQP